MLTYPTITRANSNDRLNFNRRRREIRAIFFNRSQNRVMIVWLNSVGHGSLGLRDLLWIFLPSRLLGNRRQRFNPNETRNLQEMKNKQSSSQIFFLRCCVTTKSPNWKLEWSRELLPELSIVLTGYPGEEERQNTMKHMKVSSHILMGKELEYKRLRLG